MAKYQAGDYVEPEFTDDTTGENEWMWVEAESCDDERHVLYGRLDSAPVPVCLAGARRCPPEDCGGPYGYQELLEALRDPTNPQHTEMRAWIADLYGSEARFNPEAFSLDAINESLQQFTKRKSHHESRAERG
jgi:hypothetical protein